MLKTLGTKPEKITDLTSDEISEVNGSFLAHIAIALGVIGPSIYAGYKVGSDIAAKENARNGR